MAARNILEDKRMKEEVLVSVEKEIKKECKTLCSRKKPSLLSYTNPDALIKLTDVQVNNELKTMAPILHRFMRAAVVNERSQKRKKHTDSKHAAVDRSIPVVSMASSLLLRARCPSMSANAYRLSTLLWHAGAEKQVQLTTS